MHDGDMFWPFGLHEGMFKPTIDKLGTSAQRDKWLGLANTYGISGTYAQTEMGHGKTNS